jgi:beta-glucanase (GH16 family)
MKKIYSVIAVLVTSLALNAQITVDDFESGTNAGWSAVTGMGYVDVRENEFKGGLNESNYVMFAQRAAEDDNWAGAILNNYVQSGYKYLHAYMYRNNSATPNLKVSDTNAQDLAPMNTIVANQWQDVVWDISAYETIGTEFLMFMVDRETLTGLAWMLIDNIILSNDPTPRTSSGGGSGEIGEYQLVWNEDFTESSLDLATWNIETNGDGGGNNELQYYCDRGVSLGQEPTTGKHCLILTATKENYQGKKCTSGRVNSKGKLTYTYGKIEARIKIPNTANGLWPAFWQLGANIDQVGWPQCGETDIIEMGHSNGFGGNQDRYFNGAMHIGEAWNSVWGDAQSSTWSYSLQDTFHILTMIWTPTSVDMYMDKDAHPENGAYFHAALESNTNPYYDRKEVFGKPNFIIANVAVGGNFPGIYNIDGITALASGPRSMYIDWIRIYQRGDANQSFSTTSSSDPIEPESITGIEMPTMTTDEPTKILHNGQVLIMRNGQVFTITGQRIQ